MGIFDKILGKKEKVDKADKKSESGGSTSTMEVEPPKKDEKKSEKTATKKAKSAKKTKPKKEVAKRKVSKKDENIAHKILFENIISEKSTRLAAENKYVFKVDKNSGKFQIKEAVEGYYGVQVLGVNTVKIKPKKRIHGRTVGWKKGLKKAVVTLREGDTITAVKGV